MLRYLACAGLCLAALSGPTAKAADVEDVSHIKLDMSFADFNAKFPSKCSPDTTNKIEFCQAKGKFLAFTVDISGQFVHDRLTTYTTTLTSSAKDPVSVFLFVTKLSIRRYGIPTGQMTNIFGAGKVFNLIIWDTPANFVYLESNWSSAAIPGETQFTIGFSKFPPRTQQSGS